MSAVVGGRWHVNLLFRPVFLPRASSVTSWARRPRVASYRVRATSYSTDGLYIKFFRTRPWIHTRLGLSLPQRLNPTPFLSPFESSLSSCVGFRPRHRSSHRPFAFVVSHLAPLASLCAAINGSSAQMQPSSNPQIEMVYIRERVDWKHRLINNTSEPDCRLSDTDHV